MTADKTMMRRFAARAAAATLSGAAILGVPLAGGGDFRWRFLGRAALSPQDILDGGGTLSADLSARGEDWGGRVSSG